VLIACSQIKDWLGLSVGKMPADFFAQLGVIGSHLSTFNPYAFALGGACLVGLFLWPHLWGKRSPIPQAALDTPFIRQTVELNARIPGPVVALVTLTLISWYFKFPVETIGARFGSIPQGLPAFQLPDFSWETVKLLVAPTLTIALLGAIESLLCARVADQFAALPKHDPNQELMAQGVANFIVPFFGGMPATGTIARTVTNIRSGGTSPVAGMVHAVTLLVIVLAAAPLALNVPLAVLAGILLFVAWNMGEWHEFARLRHFSNHYRLLMLGTFLLTVVFDLTVAVEVGLVAACALFVRRMSALFKIEPVAANGQELRYKLYGALFFGAVARVDTVIRAVESGAAAPGVVLDAMHLVALDTSGLDALRQLHKAVLQRGGSLRIESLHEQPRSLIERSGFAHELAVHEVSEEVAV
jgi:SulP family sulfate permease